MKKKQVTTAVAAILIAAALPGQCLATPGPVSGTPEDYEKQAKLEDNILEYDELGDLIENYNSDYKKTKSSIVKSVLNLDAGKQMAKDAAELMEDAKDLKSDGMDEETKALYESYKETARELRKQAQKITNDDLGSSYEKMLSQTKTKLTAATQQLMITYSQTAANKELMDKQFELAKASMEATERMAGLGLKSQEDVLAAQKNVKQAEYGAAQLNSGLQNMKQNLLVLTGWNHDANPEIRSVPSSDLSRIAEMNPEKDLQAAIGTNYELQSIRNQSAVGSPSRNVKKRNVSQSEQSLASTLQSLYASVLAKKEAYEASVSNYEAEVQKMDMANRKNSMGMMGSMEYLKAQVDYLTAKAAKETADLDLFHAMETYDWAVKGLVVSSTGGQ